MSRTEQIAAIVAHAIEQRVFPGAVVLVARGERIEHLAAYGSTMYEAPGSQPVTPATIYDLASLTKMYTATAALRLVDTGLLDLARPLQHYLPAVAARDVLVSHLLTHSSGLDLRLSLLRARGRAGLLAAAYAAEQRYPPGTVVAYSNINSLLLGELVAALYGAPLDQAIKALVTSPLGVQQTQFCPPPGLQAQIAPTELDAAWRGGLVHGTVHDESAHTLGGVAGHAGLFSTAYEVYQFCRAWLLALNAASQPGMVGGTYLVQPETARSATRNQTPGMALACGWGWMLDRENFMGNAPAGSFGHTGFTGPAMVVVPARQAIVVVLSNRVYPQRQPPTHHPVTAAIVDAALVA